MEEKLQNADSGKEKKKKKKYERKDILIHVWFDSFSLLSQQTGALFETLLQYSNEQFPWTFFFHQIIPSLVSIRIENIVALFRGMHVSPAKHSYAWLPRKCYRTYIHTNTHRQTDTGQSDPYVPLCFAGDTIKNDKAQSGEVMNLISQWHSVN